MPTDAASGWALVAQDENAADLIAAVLELDQEATYTRSEVAERAAVPLKTLYLEETLERLADADLLDRVDGDADGEPAYAVRDDDPVTAAREFDEVLAERLGRDDGDGE